MPSDQQDANNNQRKSLLVTGGAGFLGSHVIKSFLGKYPELMVVCLDKLERTATIDNIRQEISRNRNLVFIQGDVCELSFVSQVVKDYNVRYVMHFAGFAGVDYSFLNSPPLTQTNVYGTHVLLEVTRNHKIEKFVYVSSSSLYDGSSSKEDGAIVVTNPYTASKAGAEFLIRSYGESFQYPFIVVRPCNIFGPCEYPDRVIPKFIFALANKQKCVVHGDGSALRSFLYVDDFVEAMHVVYEKGKIWETYNIGSQKEVSILKLAQELSRLIHSKEDNDMIVFTDDRPVNVPGGLIDTQKLRDLGWNAGITWNEGLRRTISWYTKEDNLHRWTPGNVRIRKPSSCDLQWENDQATPAKRQKK